MKMIIISVALIAVVASGQEKQRTLFDAIKSGDIAEVRKMASTKENVDIRDPQNWTPLMVAAKQANVEAIKALVDAGADINAKDMGFTVIDQVESYLRRTGDNKRRTIEMMKRDGFSEKLIEAIERDARELNESPEQIQKWQSVLGYLKQANESKTEEKQ
jgi:ankyrin repeat protein